MGLKLLPRLHPPQSSKLRLDGEAVPEARVDDYRQFFSSIFSNDFLFEDLPRAEGATLKLAQQYPERFEVAHKVRVEDGAFTSPDLWIRASASDWP